MASQMDDHSIVSDIITLDKNETTIILSDDDTDSLNFVVNPLRGQSADGKACEVTRTILRNIDTSSRGAKRKPNRSKRSSGVSVNTRKKSFFDPNVVVHPPSGIKN